MIRGALATAALVVLLVGGTGAGPATGDVTPPPLPDPSEFPSQGPTYVITPGVGGSELPAPSDRKAVEKAKQSDQSSAARPGSTPSSPEHASPTRAARPVPELVTGPQTPFSVDMDQVDHVGILWRGFAGAVMALVLIEVVLVRQYLRKRFPRP